MDIRKEKIKALSWKQPFGQLMLHGKIETRTWNTNYRGLVLICTSKVQYPFKVVNNTISGSELTNTIWKTLGFEKFSEWPKGKAIGIGRLVDSRRMEPSDEKKCFVKWSPDLFCHVYEDVRAIEPFDWKGTQGWKEVSEEIKKQIKFI